MKTPVIIINEITGAYAASFLVRMLITTLRPFELYIPGIKHIQLYPTLTFPIGHFTNKVFKKGNLKKVWHMKTQNECQ